MKAPFLKIIIKLICKISGQLENLLFLLTKFFSYRIINNMRINKGLKARNLKLELFDLARIYEIQHHAQLIYTIGINQSYNCSHCDCKHKLELAFDINIEVIR